MFVSGPNVQNRQLVIVEFFAQKWIQDFYLSDLWLTDKDRVKKVDRDPGMIGTRPPSPRPAAERAQRTPKSNQRPHRSANESEIS